MVTNYAVYPSTVPDENPVEHVPRRHADALLATCRGQERLDMAHRPRPLRPWRMRLPLSSAKCSAFQKSLFEVRVFKPGLSNTLKRHGCNIARSSN